MTDDVLRALADPLRAQIVGLLAGEQLCTCHLVGLTGARQTSLSNHLRVLREAGIVEAEPAGASPTTGCAPKRWRRCPRTTPHSRRGRGWRWR